MTKSRASYAAPSIWRRRRIEGWWAAEKMAEYTGTTLQECSCKSVVDLKIGDMRGHKLVIEGRDKDKLGPVVERG